MTVVNAGSIGGNTTVSHGAYGAGVYFTAGGSVINEKSALISGYNGIYGTGGAVTVLDAVRFAAGFNDLLVVDPGAVFVGTVTGGNAIGATAVSALELASAASIGTLSGIGTQYVDFGAIIFDPGADWLISGDTSGLAGTIVGFVQGDTIEIAGITATGSSYAGGVLTLTEASGAATLNFAGSFTSAAFQVTKVSGGVDVTTSVTASGIYDGSSLTNSGLLLSVTLGAGAVLTNASTGVISDPSGVAVYSATTSTGVSVINAGNIASTAGNNHRGIELRNGGYVGNAATGVITAINAVGLYIGGLAGTVQNAGLIATSGGTHAPVVLSAGGYLSNASTGTITAAADTTSAAMYVTGGLGTLINAGQMLAPGNNVDFKAGGIVTNRSTGTISSSGGSGIYVAGTSGSVVNYGRILSALGTAVNFLSGGIVTNQSTGTISGGGTGVGIVATGGVGTVVNAGTISGGGKFAAVFVNGGAGTVINSGELIAPQSVAVELKAGGSVTNQSAGTISGKYPGVIMYGAPGTVVNFGKLVSSLSDTVLLEVGGTVTNQSTGTIASNVGGVAIIGAGATVVDAGTISGGTGDAVFLGSGFTNRMVVDPGAVFDGAVSGGNTIGATASSTLELASGTSAGTLSGLGSKYIDFAQTTIDAGASWSLTGANTIVSGATLSELAGATLTDTSALENDGAIVLDPSTMTVAGLTGTGSVTIEAGSTLDVQGTIANAETVVFGGSGAYLHLENPDSASGSVANFDVGETLDLKGIGFGSIRYADGLLSFEGGSFAVSLAPGNTELGSTTSSDGSEIFVLCFCANTQILTPSGERPVQDLAVGDMVTTHTGATRPIVWIGIGKVLATRGRRNAATPVIVRKGALTDNVPNRDLRVTKGHAFLLDDVLIPVEFLVNHRSIAWDDRAQEVELYHIELDTHDVLVANGAPAESYRDDGNRWLFRNANSGWGLRPLQPCAPVLTGGPLVDATWCRLLDRAGPRPGAPLTDDPDLHLLADGERLDMIARTGEARVFTLSAVPSVLRIVSRAAAPAELGLARDPRVLGVALQRVTVRKGRLLTVIEAIDDQFTSGFHAFETDNGFRWTNGDATLPTEMFAGFIGPLELVLHIGGSTRYLADERTEQAA
jgi:hypothetical protein